MTEKPEKYDMFGILNNVGSLWSRHTFADREHAEKFLREHSLNKTCDLSKHRVVPVKVTIRIDSARSESPVGGKVGES